MSDNKKEIFKLTKVDKIPSKYTGHTIASQIIDDFINGENDLVKLDININPDFQYQTTASLYSSLKYNIATRGKEQEISVSSRADKIYLKKISPSIHNNIPKNDRGFIQRILNKIMFWRSIPTLQQEDQN